MSLIQSNSNAFQLIDRTNDVILIPQNPTLMSDSGIWVQEYLATRTVTFEERNGSISLVKDQVPGSKPQTTSNDVRKLHSYPMTHHPYMDALFPQDIAGKTRPGSMGTQLDTKDAAVLVKMEKMRKSFDRTVNFARFRTLAAGDLWAPNGTIAGNLYTDFGLTRKSVNFVLGTAGTDIIAKCEEIIAHFMAQASAGQEVTGVTAYCSSGFFTGLINHAKVQAAYNLYAATAPQQISRDRAGGLGLYRRFNFSNIEFIEVIQSVEGTPLVNANEAVFVANDGDGSFVTFFGPPNRFDLVNTTAEELYLWQFEDERKTQITLEGEFNMINLLKRPAMVATGTVS